MKRKVWSSISERGSQALTDEVLATVYPRDVIYTPGVGRPRKTSRREDRHIVGNERVQPTASSVAIQTQVASSLRAPASSRTIRRSLAEGHLRPRCPLRESCP
ncbi:HTH_Tnp_Tc3_2 domain-containing protein [Trichonephila clavipes]|nr:HTH_Tnp_Tc3_2 domain-containing protein [Trichonephila clavipes]